MYMAFRLRVQTDTVFALLPDAGLDAWLEATVDFDAATTSSVVLRAVRGGADRSEPRGDIAIDDVTVSAATSTLLDFFFALGFITRTYTHWINIDLQRRNYYFALR